MADEWVVTRLHGTVQQMVDGAWQPLAHGDVVPDTRPIRTAEAGHVRLERGKESLELGPGTQIRIFDRGGSLPFTTVKEAFGTVSVEAEVRNVQHFAVETPYLAAVVKGTRFVVRAGKGDGSVTVLRGHVAVDDTAGHRHVTIAAGQAVALEKIKGGESSFSVQGSGTLPTVVDDAGRPVDPPVKPAAIIPKPAAVPPVIAQQPGPPLMPPPPVGGGLLPVPPKPGDHDKPSDKGPDIQGPGKDGPDDHPKPPSPPAPGGTGKENEPPHSGDHGKGRDDFTGKGQKPDSKGHGPKGDKDHGSKGGPGHNLG